MVERNQSIEVRRGVRIASSLLSAFSNRASEVRVTALLGYIAGLDPKRFLDFFRIPGKCMAIFIERKEDEPGHVGRTDIRIETTKGVAIWEAKLGVVDPSVQAIRYAAKWRILITDYLPTRIQRAVRNTAYYRWSDIVPLLEGMNSPLKINVLSQELLNYLEEVSMAKTKDLIEIYARDLNDEPTLRMFLSGHMYACDLKGQSRMSEALYFAPYIGQHLAQTVPAVQEGISFLGRVLSIDVIESVEDWKELAKKHFKKKGNMRGRLKLIEEVGNSWKWDYQRFAFFLNSPRLVFNPPIKKHQLQKGRGWLSRQFYSFEDFFDAWNSKSL